MISWARAFRDIERSCPEVVAVQVVGRGGHKEKIVGTRQQTGKRNIFQKLVIDFFAPGGFPLDQTRGGGGIELSVLSKKEDIIRQ